MDFCQKCGLREEELELGTAFPLISLGYIAQQGGTRRQPWHPETAVAIRWDKLNLCRKCAKRLIVELTQELARQ